MNNTLKDSIKNGDLILFLGAGASRSCKNSSGNNLLDGKSLAKELAKRSSMEYADEDLQDVYAAAREVLGCRLDTILEELLRHTKPSGEYHSLANYAWRRIYTVNIDDGLERAFSKSKQNVCVRLSSDPIEDRDQFFQKLDLIKLNGSIDRLPSGIIFSASEYAKSTNQSRPWYEQCGSDFMRNTFLFIGTKLNEPLLKYHIERYKENNKQNPGRSYVITPNATAIEKASLKQYNIEHIPGTLKDFTTWLEREFPKKLTPEMLARASLPPYAAALSTIDKERYTKLFDGVFLVKKDTAPKIKNNGAIHDFYKGFKPTWDDIVSRIPANLEIFSTSINVLRKNLGRHRVIPLVGPAGSGKSTLLMQIAYESAKWNGFSVYYFEEPLFDVKETLIAIEEASKNSINILVAIDNVDLVAESIVEAFKTGKLLKTTIICAERQSIWERKTKSKLIDFTAKMIHVNEFTEQDAHNILEKLQDYGSWTVLGKLTEEQRIDTLIKKSDKQLLIALLEATYGRGFETIIRKDYESLENDEQRIFFLTVGVITERNFGAPIELVDRALSANKMPGAGILTNSLSGIIVKRGNKLAARHRIYVQYLLEHVIDPKLTKKALEGLLVAFSHYESPVIKHVSRSEAAIYKGIINHKFMWNVLRGRVDLISSLYRSFEKSFEQDGLFWLQYGLALRDMQNDTEALHKLRTAYNAYQMPHTQHALGQQLLIMGRKSGDRETARSYAEEARSLLEPLEDIMDSDDTYPIVTLAEGHTALMREIFSEDDARNIAKSYLATLERKKKSQPSNSRLQECYEKIFRYAATGAWMDVM